MADPQYNGRTASIYFSTAEEKKKYDALADEAGVPTAKFLLSLAEEALAARAMPRTDDKLKDDLRALAEDNRHLRDELHVQTLLREKAEIELRRVRAEAILSDQDGIIDTTELIQALKTGPIQDQALSAALRLSTPDELTALGLQLEEYERIGWIKRVTRGWKWIG